MIGPDQEYRHDVCIVLQSFSILLEATISVSGYLAINKWVLSKFHCKCGHDVHVSAGKVRDIAATGYVPWSDPVCWEKQSKCVPGRAFFMSTTLPDKR